MVQEIQPPQVPVAHPRHRHAGTQREHLGRALGDPSSHGGADAHYQRRLICRVSQILPSAFYQALGKEAVCRVPERKHSANNWHSAKRWFAECQIITLGKGPPPLTAGSRR